jgi:hypothetical protein
MRLVILGMALGVFALGMEPCRFTRTRFQVAGQPHEWCQCSFLDFSEGTLVDSETSDYIGADGSVRLINQRTEFQRLSWELESPTDSGVKFQIRFAPNSHETSQLRVAGSSRAGGKFYVNAPDALSSPSDARCVQ